ncbi:hypothetical protein [Amycolatopsis pigmentata]|uniref:Uncharacterized protein n=1 Tax=Amycolatopsis pigmentata TaxID=450801 RepID=A0ABW5FYS6_9PSEU
MIVLSRGSQDDQSARLFFPLSGRQGAHPSDATRAGKERPVDTIAEARKAAEETAEETA